ncbi:fused MFS/spermidine synthase [Candidatus Micrarchaeota archaeon]|nr:fused MFS/spermidine synthase [Candidatus Micrarchaeota archaeon]
MEQEKEILIASFISGFCLMVIEIGGPRLTAPYIGNTIFSWAAVIASVLGALSLGYYYGGKMADKNPTKEGLGKIFIICSITTFLAYLLGTFVGPLAAILDITTASILTSLIFFPAAATYGIVSPYIIKLTSKAGKEGENSGRVFAVSTLGSILGTLGTGFILVPNLPVKWIFIGTGIIMALLGIYLKAIKMNSPKYTIVLIFLMTLSVATAPIEIYKGTTVYEGESPYYHIRVLDGDFFNESSRILLLDNAISSGHGVGGKAIFEYEKQTQKTYELMGKTPKVLMLGVAAGTIIDGIFKAKPDATVTGVEIDEKTIEVGKRFFNLTENERTEIVIEDARRYIEKTDQRYDFIIIDTYRGKSVPFHLTSDEFLKQLKEKGTTDAIVVVNVIGSIQGDRSELFQSIYKTFANNYRKIVLFPTNKDYEKRQNIMLIATDRNISEFENKYKTELAHVQLDRGKIITDDLNPTDILIMEALR